jgi:RNA polymerase sigma-70 factor (ECF subfamily)
MEAVNTFTRLRPRLLGIGYRMLGTRADAEDVVQDAWLRWDATDKSTIESAEAWLVTTVTRLAIDRLRAARRERDAYAGFWLPEPLVSIEENTPGLLRYFDGDLESAQACSVERGCITGFYVVRNPDKLVC